MTSLINQVDGVVTSFNVDISGKIVNYKELLRDFGTSNQFTSSSSSSNTRLLPEVLKCTRTNSRS